MRKTRVTRETVGLDGMKMLAANKGKEVVVKHVQYGRMDTYRGPLKDVTDFRGVSLDGMYVPFVGYGSAIAKITRGQEVLYENPWIGDDYDVRKPEEVDVMTAKIFGDEVAERFKKKRLDAQKLQRQETEKLDKEAKAKAPTLIERGRALVKEGLAEEWDKYTTKNTKDFYSAGVVESAVNVMKALTAGADPKKAMATVPDGITGFMAGCTASAVVHFHERGEEFKAWWNGQYGAKDATGVVNPAVLTIGIRK